MTTIYACHFLGADMRSRNGTEEPWQVGETRTVEGTLKLCERGYHYCQTFGDALTGQYLYGPMACIVEVEDGGEHDEHKAVSRSRKLIEVWDASKVMRAFAFAEADTAMRVHAVKALRAVGRKADAAKLAALAPNAANYAAAAAADAATNAANYAAADAAYDAAADRVTLQGGAATNADYANAANAAYDAYRKEQRKRFDAVMAELTGWVPV